MPTEARTQKLQRVASQRQRGFVAVVENITDPHNAQAIARTCDAFGIQDVYLIFEENESFNPRRVGKLTSSSANKWIRYHKFDTTVACYEALKAEGYTIVATALTDDSVSIFDTAFLDEKIALVFGNEHAGLTKAAIDGADKTLLIPMQGIVQSLNISVCAAICLYEVFRQRQASGKDFVYDAASAEALLTDFLER